MERLADKCVKESRPFLRDACSAGKGRIILFGLLQSALFTVQRDKIQNMRSFYRVDQQHGNAQFLLLLFIIRRQSAEGANGQIRYSLCITVGAVVAGGPQEQTSKQAPAVVGFQQWCIILSAAVKLNYKTGFRPNNFFAELYCLNTALLDVAHGTPLQRISAVKRSSGYSPKYL